MSKVVRWETPFADALHPALLPQTHIETDVELTVVVWPNGTQTTPCYVVRFESAPVVHITEEQNAPPRDGWAEGGGFGVESCSYMWLESPMLVAAGRVGRTALFDDAALPMQHFVLAGGDWIVDVLSTRQPSVSEQWLPNPILPRR